MEPASIRYKNPGAMWGNALAIKWGAQKKAVTLHDGKGQGNNIAVFPTYVQGICAQLDLWRTSKNYSNKRFADAIAIWSGHNEVPSYIAFCKKRVPGLTENTIMNDAFWRSSSGIAFLKAQAWHEAGKPFPAPDADWIEAQRRVFSGVAPAKPVAAPAPVPTPAAPVAIDTDVAGDPDLYSAQKRLKGRNYSPGLIDGKWGSGIAGALSGFRNDRGMKFAMPGSLEEFHEVKDEVATELQLCEDTGWFRPVTAARASGDAATVAAVAPEVVPVKQNRLLTIWGAIGTFFAGIYKTFSDTISSAWDWLWDLFTDHKDDLPTDPSFLQTAWGYVTAIPSEVWIFAAAIGFVVLAVKAHGAVKKITESVQTGARQ